MLKRFVVATLAGGLLLFGAPQLAFAHSGGHSSPSHHADSRGGRDGGHERHAHSYGYYPGYYGYYGGYDGSYYGDGGYSSGYCGQGQYNDGRGYCADRSYGDSPRDEGVYDCRYDPYRDNNRYR